jgi:hypothetical protein
MDTYEQLAARVEHLETSFEDRRKFIHELNNQLQRISGFADIARAMHELHTENGRKIDAIIERNVQADAAMSKLVAGFPDGDAEAHRRYHEAIIERIELRNKIIREAMVKVAGSGFLAGAAWLAYAVWQAFIVSVHKGG